MTKGWLVVSCVIATTVIGPRQSVADPRDHVVPATRTTPFPDFSRQSQADVCLATYGMENASILDCVARDEDVRGKLAKLWADIDDRYKKECLLRLEGGRIDSYFFLDRCIRSLERDAAGQE